MKYRRLRIAVSVFFALVAVAFMALWVLSYISRYDLTNPPKGKPLYKIVSVGGVVQCDFTPQPFVSMKSWELDRKPIGKIRTVRPEFLWKSDATGSSLRTPYWLYLLGCISIVTVVWFPWSNCYSLRTMLMATTLIAVVLGMAVWASR